MEGMIGLPQVSLPRATLSGLPLGRSLVALRDDNSWLLALTRKLIRNA